MKSKKPLKKKRHALKISFIAYFPKGEKPVKGSWHGDIAKRYIGNLGGEKIVVKKAFIY